LKDVEEPKEGNKILSFFTNIFCGKKKKADLGLIMGVLIPTLLKMYGVVIFLRLGVIVGQVIFYNI
jgi:hypothetical protein